MTWTFMGSSGKYFVGYWLNSGDARGMIFHKAVEFGALLDACKLVNYLNGGRMEHIDGVRLLAKAKEID